MAIAVDDANNQLIVKDVALNKLLYYNSLTFEYIKEQTLAFYSDCMEYYKKRTCPFSDTLKETVSLTDIHPIGACIVRVLSARIAGAKNSRITERKRNLDGV